MSFIEGIDLQDNKEEKPEPMRISYGHKVKRVQIIKVFAIDASRGKQAMDLALSPPNKKGSLECTATTKNLLDKGWLLPQARRAWEDKATAFRPENAE